MTQSNSAAFWAERFPRLNMDRILSSNIILLPLLLQIPESTEGELKNHHNFRERALKTNIRSSISQLHFRVWRFLAYALSQLGEIMLA